MKTLLFILSFAVMISLSAATSTNKGKTENGATAAQDTTDPEQKTPGKDVKKPVKFDVRAYGVEVNAQMDQLAAKLKTGKCKSLDFLAYSSTFAEFSKHPRIEDATKIYRQFFEKSAMYLKGMYVCKSTMESLEEYDMLNDPRYIEAGKNYDPSIKNFLIFFKDPPRIPKK